MFLRRVWRDGALFGRTPAQAFFVKCDEENNPPENRGDAITAARFSIVIDGYQIASFSELVGITTEVEPVELLESTDKEVLLKKLPGKRKPPTLALKPGASEVLMETVTLVCEHIQRVAP